jgi:hypothetical protein
MGQYILLAFALPEGVFGPVDFLAFCWLALACAMLVIGRSLFVVDF